MRPHYALLLPLIACGRDAGFTKFNSEPGAQITSPADGATVLEGSTILLRGQASDPNHDASLLLARWFVADQEACTSAAPASDGTTTCEVRVPDGAAMDVRLEVIDPDGAGGVATATYDVTPNADPVPAILSPVADAVHYSDQLITFRGTVSDAEDGPDALTVWWEDGADRLDAVETIPTSSGEVLGYALLAEGPHALELHVQDSAGNEGIATVLIDVGPPNSPPGCAITAPVSGGASEEGAVVAFSAAVSDPDVPASLLTVAWESDKDGPLGTSAPDSAGEVSFRTSNLSADDHRVTMTVTDELGASCVAGIDWTVATPPSIELELPPDLHSVVEAADQVVPALSAQVEHRVAQHLADPADAGDTNLVLNPVLARDLQHRHDEVQGREGDGHLVVVRLFVGGERRGGGQHEQQGHRVLRSGAIARGGGLIHTWTPEVDLSGGRETEHVGRGSAQPSHAVNHKVGPTPSATCQKPGTSGSHAIASPWSSNAKGTATGSPRSEKS